MKDLPIIPVILCGGTGTRLWPLSRKKKPKPFLRLPDGQTLLTKALQRAMAINTSEPVVLIANIRSKHLIEQSIRGFDREKIVLIFEPVGKNTAPALYLAYLWAKANNRTNQYLLLLTADHLILNIKNFLADINLTQYQPNQWVLFGIEPTHPKTDYGYIQTQPTNNTTKAVLSFVEKPTKKKAAQMLAQGNYYWNSGMLVCSLDSALEAYQTYAPQITQLDQWIKKQVFFSNSIEIPLKCYAKIKDASIDYALLEKHPNLQLLVASFDWKDIGSWESFADLLLTDEHNNRAEENAAVFHQSTNNIVHASEQPKKTIVCVGVNNLLVIDTKDVTFICPTSKFAYFKKIYNEVLEKNRLTKLKL